MCQFKTWCKGDKSNIENTTDHFCQDTRQNALAAVTNLGHVTPFLLLGTPHHLTIQWVREITSLDSKLPDQTEVQIRTDIIFDTLAERNHSQSSRSLFAQRRCYRCCLQSLQATYFDTSFLKNTGHVIRDVITGSAVAQHCYNGDVSFLWEKWKLWPPVKSKPVNRLTHNLSELITSTRGTLIPNLVKIRSRGTSGETGKI